jgi:WD40 repeat protein
MFLRMSRLVPLTVLLGAIAACTSSSDQSKPENDPKQSRANVDIGNFLFADAPWPNLFDDGAPLADPIRVPGCHLTVLDRVEVPSKEDGAVEWLGVEVTDRSAVDPKDLYVHKRTKKMYARLRPGDVVKQGQVIAQLNDEMASLEADIANSNIKGAQEELKAAVEAIKYYVQNVKIEKDAGSSTAAIVAAEANLAKAISERASKDWTVKRTEGEYQKALEKLSHHYVRAPFDGVIVQFVKRVGEGVKATESMLQIQNSHRALGIEGNLEVQYASKVKIGSQVYFEPSLLEPPLAQRLPHTSSKPITAVAVGIRNKKPVIISASEDGAVVVWDRSKVYASWKHPANVRAVAVTRPGAERSLVLTGCDDGKVRLYSLDDLSKEPVMILDGRHEGGVPAAAFAPDGAYCVTADDRGAIFLYQTASGKRHYAFPPEHTGPVTSLCFTPQCRVISAARDNTALIWKVGEKAAAVEANLNHPTGEVADLGVSDDGGQMLLDLDKNRLCVVDVANQRIGGTIRQATDNKFANFALFSPVIGDKGDRLILTAGNIDGVMQLWRWTAGAGRGSELKKLVCDGYAPVTCAAFSPAAEDGLIVAGTRKGDVYLWSMPTSGEIASRYTARITNISPNLESSGMTVRIQAETDNSDPKLQLRPGSTATLVISQTP